MTGDLSNSNISTTRSDEEQQQQQQPTITKRLLCIRHAKSVANEFMEQPGNTWGEATFTDDGNLIDAPLSQTGIQQCVDNLQLQLQDEFVDFLPLVDLVICSPLTRCLETLTQGVEPTLRQYHQFGNDQKRIPLLAVPYLTERIYTASDTGSPVNELQTKFPLVDFSDCPNGIWWYSHQYPESEEWRPYGQGQWYAVPGEPEAHFETRMLMLDQWIRNRPERNILLVAHWGVLRHLTSGTEWNNAQGKLLEWKYDPSSGASVVSHI
jgi:broad specificity phosphatase PhoE